MAASGIKVRDSVKEYLKSMQVNHKEDDADKRIRIMTLKITDTEIVEDKIIRQEDLKTEGNVYKYLVGLMEEGDCKYIVYDCHYKTRDQGVKEELVFIMWSSDCAKAKMKMPYAASKGYLKKCMEAKHEFEFHGLEEISPCAFVNAIKKVAKCDICDLEGDENIYDDQRKAY